MVWSIHTHACRSSCRIGWNQVWEGKMGSPSQAASLRPLLQGPQMSGLPFSSSWCPEYVQPLHHFHCIHPSFGIHSSSMRLEEFEDEGEFTGSNYPQTCPPTPSVPWALCPMPALACHVLCGSSSFLASSLHKPWNQPVSQGQARWSLPLLTTSSLAKLTYPQGHGDLRESSSTSWLWIVYDLLVRSQGKLEAEGKAVCSN